MLALGVGAGCGGDDDNDTPATAKSATTSTTVAEAEPKTIQVDKTVWWAGFTIEVQEAGFEATGGGSEGGTLTVEGLYENRQPDNAVLSQSDVSLEVKGEAITPQLADLPSVPPDGTARGSLEFFLEDPFDPAGTVLVFGTPDTNQSRVPLGEGDAETFEPVELDVTGTVTVSDIKVDLTGGTLEASYEPNKEGTLILRLIVDMVYQGDSAGGALLGATQFSVATPDGTDAVGQALAADDLVAEAAAPNVPFEGLGISFEVDEPGTGDYVLTYTADATDESGQIDFTV